jgi:NAD(P)-dependent dehydrogenase (short-subunit alcohol dehydrogenase family)
VGLFVVTGGGGLLGAALVDALSEPIDNLVVATDIRFAKSEARQNVIRISGSIFEDSFIRNLTHVVDALTNSNTWSHVIEEFRGLPEVTLNPDPPHAFIAQNRADRGLKGVISCIAEPEPRSTISSELSAEVIAKVGALGDDRDAMIRIAFSRYTAEEFVSQLKTNVVGVHAVIVGLFDQILRSENCSIVNFASQYSFRPPNQDLFVNPERFTFKPPGYSASKAALVNYTQYLSNIFRGTGVRFNCIAPGNVRTNQSDAFVDRYSNYTNSGRMMNISDVVGPVLFLLSPESDYINGTTLIVDGGWSVK